MINVVIKEQNDIDRQNNINYRQTVTYATNQNPTGYIISKTKVIMDAIDRMLASIERNKDILEDIPSQYKHIRIPKKKGGYREIVDPSPRLKLVQREIMSFLQNDLELHTHNAAHAYVKQRDILTNANVHKNAKMILGLDIHDFFGSIDRHTLKTQLLKINNINYFESKKPFLDKIIEPCLLNNVLPQGSPTSPLLSNLIMIEFDDYVTRVAYYNNLKYTRYADDIFISGENIEKPIALQIAIQGKLSAISPNIKLNKEKTKILRPGKCYIAGIKLNKENKLVFGSDQKIKLKHNIYNLFIKDLTGECVTEEVQEILGLFNYAHRIEPAYFNYIEQKYLKQFNSSATTLVKHFKKYL